MIDAEFVSAIQEGAEVPTVLEIDGRHYLIKPERAKERSGWDMVDLPRPEAQAAALVFGTLQSMAGYLRENRDKLDVSTLALVVKGPREVTLVGPLTGEFRQRETLAVSNLNQLIGEHDQFPFGQFLDHEDFMIKMQSRFVDDANLQSVLALIGNIRDETVRQVDDDGVTQSVTAKAGVVLKQDVPVPRFCMLAPYRTFREVEQPASKFVLRLRQGGEGGKPTCALFEADGSIWRGVAIQSVAAWLRSNVTGVAVYA